MKYKLYFVLGPDKSLCSVLSVKLCDGSASLHIQKVLHAGLWSGTAVHQHHWRGPTGKKLLVCYTETRLQTEKQHWRFICDTGNTLAHKITETQDQLHEKKISPVSLICMNILSTRKTYHLYLENIFKKLLDSN